MRIRNLPSTLATAVTALVLVTALGACDGDGGDDGGTPDDTASSEWEVTVSGAVSAVAGGSVTTVVRQTLGNTQSHSVAAGSHESDAKMSGSFGLPADGSTNSTNFLSFSLTLEDGTECPTNSAVTAVDVEVVSDTATEYRIEFSGETACPAGTVQVDGWLVDIP